MDYTIENFENGLLQKGISYEVLEKHKQQIGHWFYETEDMTIEELVDDFIHHWDLEMSN